MNRFIMTDAHGFKDIENKIENVGDISVCESVTEFQRVIIENKEIEIFPFNMNMYIEAINAPAVMCKLIHQRLGVMERVDGRIIPGRDISDRFWN